MPQETDSKQADDFCLWACVLTGCSKSSVPLERLWEGIKALHMESESHGGQKTKRTPLKDEVLSREQESVAQGADQALGEQAQRERKAAGAVLSNRWCQPLHPALS